MSSPSHNTTWTYTVIIIIIIIIHFHTQSRPDLGYIHCPHPMAADCEIEKVTKRERFRIFVNRSYKQVQLPVKNVELYIIIVRLKQLQ